MKRIIRKTLPAVLILLIVLLLSGSAFAADTTAVSSTEFYVHQGETFTTTIYIPDGANIVDFELTLLYDTEKLTLVSVEENEDIKGTVVYNENVPGALAINYTRTSTNVTKRMPLLDVTFTVDGNVGVGSYDCFTVDSTKPCVAHRLNASGSPTAVDFACDFSKLVIYEMGDVDLSGGVDIADATCIRRHLASFEGSILTDFRMSLADTYYDGTIDVADAVALQRHLARLDGLYGNRVNVTFYDKDGNKYAAKSVLFGGTLRSIPSVPNVAGYSGGMWSQSPDEYIQPVYSNLERDISLYARYSNQADPAMDYYKRQLTTLLYSGDLPTNLSSDLGLLKSMNYQNGWHASLLYSSDCSYVLNSTTGAFTKPTYPQKLDLTVSITSYDNNNSIRSEDSITFSYDVPGMFQTPTKAAVEDFLKFYFTDDSDGEYRVNYDVKLISKLNNTIIPVDGTLYDNFEIRLAWYQNVNGTLVPISQVKRTTQSQSADYVAVATFNGKPLEGDGKIYIDDVEVTAIDQMEIKNYIINEIAASMGTLATEGTVLWNSDTVYGTNVTWETGAPDIGYVANNVVQLKKDAVSGSTLPLNARVSYAVDGGTEEFVLSYNLTVSCDNTIIKAPENMDPDLYRAIKTELEENLGYRGDLTSAALADVRFVNLDLSEYPDIASLRGLSYCKNLRTLNISGLHITDGTMNQIATLSYLEAFIARGCGLDNLTDGGTATLRNAVNLKMLDLTDNNFTSLDSVFAEGVKYGSLREVYLSENRLTDINALSRAPMMTYLSLSDNGLTTEGTACIENYPYLLYLSLANNRIDSVEHLTGLKYLKELRLQNNLISNVNPLRRLVNLEILYLGHNDIPDIGNLNTLTQLQILYVNDNRIFDISSLRDLTRLECINVSNNNLSSLAVLGNYKSTLTEIYAENNKLTDFSFINGAANLHILMLAGNETAMAQDNMITWLGNLTGLEILTLSDIRLNDLSFLSGMEKLVRLDVANCGLHAFSGETSNIQMIADRYATLRILNISDNDLSDGGSELMRLRNVTLLSILYADNICPDLDVYTLTYSMTELKCISLENCGVSTLNWLYKFNELLYVDLAGSKLTEVDLEACISNASVKTIKELYLDTTVPCTFTNAYRIMDFNVDCLSLSGVTVGKMEYMPYLDNIRYLNLDGTGLANLTGEDPELSDMYSVERYSTVETLDVSHAITNISTVEALPSLRTLYAVGPADCMLFYRDNLHALQRLYNAGKTCYLYDKNTVYKPVAKSEGDAILALLPDISCSITVAADGIISDNNPMLAKEINDFDITWTVSNSTNYEIRDSRLAVKSYSSIDDEKLTLTATITVYPDQEPVSRDFEIDTHILRVSDFVDVISQEEISLDGFALPEEVSVEYDEEVSAAEPTEPAAEIEDAESAEAPAEEPTVDVESEDGAAPAETPAEEPIEYEDAVASDMSDGLSLDGSAEEAPLSEEATGDEADDEFCQEAEQPAEEADPDETGEVLEEDFEEGSAISDEEVGETEEYREPEEDEDSAGEAPENAEPEEVSADDQIYPFWLDGETVSQYGSTIPCLVYNIVGLDDYMLREDGFTYSITLQAVEYPGFSTFVKPVVDEIRSAYSTVLSNGNAAPYVVVLSVQGSGSYSIMPAAPLGSITTITTSIGHYIGEEFIADETMQRSFEVTSRSFTVSYVANGGSITLKEDGSAVTSQKLPEDAPMFQNVNVARTGYIFHGWYTDKAMTQLFYDGTGTVTMPSHDLTLYAKWTAHSYHIRFDANGGTVDAEPILALCDQPIGTLPVPTRDLYTFEGWFTEKDGGELVSDASTRTTAEDITVYAHWTANTHKVSFVVNDSPEYPAVLETASKTVVCDSAIGSLPTPTRSYYDFDGWYTEAAAGTQVTEDMIVTNDSDYSLYAHWTKHPLSDWVLASNVPSDGQIVSEKWTYTLTSNTESTSSSLSGWTLIGTRWNKTGSGSTNYAYFPGTFNTGHWIYTSLAKGPYTAQADNGSTKREVSNTWAGYVYWHWAYNAAYYNVDSRWISDRNQWAGSSRGLTDYNYKYFYAFQSGTNAPAFSGFTYTWGANGKYDSGAATYNCSGCLPSGADTSATSGLNNPRFLRFDYYKSTYTDYQKIYQYQKVENLESSTSVTASDTISNVQKWVRYIGK